MSRAWSTRRARLFETARPTNGRGDARPGRDGRHGALVGRDMKRARAGETGRSPWSFLLPLLVGGLAAALLLVALRNSILALRYDLDVALARELELRRHERAAIVRLRELRDPTRLQALALERGFVRPETVIELGNGVTRP